MTNKNLAPFKIIVHLYHFWTDYDYDTMMEKTRGIYDTIQKFGKIKAYSGSLWKDIKGYYSKKLFIILIKSFFPFSKKNLHTNTHG